MRWGGQHVLLVGVLVAAAAATLSACAGSSGSASSSSSAASSVSDAPPARQEAKRLLTLIRLPPTARRSAREPAGAGAALASNMVSIPSVPRLVELHEYFVVPSSTPATVIAWLERHRPTGSVQDDRGGGSAGERWTSFAFGRVSGFAIWP